jgi:hypothetical protein
MKSIFIVFKGKAHKSTGESLGGVGPGNGMTPDKEPSATENFSAKSTRCGKDATSAATNSSVTLVTKIFRYGDGLAHRSKMWHSTGRINW